MKSLISFAILSLILVSCTLNTQVSSLPPSTKISTALTVNTTMTSVNLASTATMSATPEIDNTPTSTSPAPINLSPISITNVNQIQLLFTYHISWDAISYGLATVSPNGKWIALAPKYSSLLYILPLTWTSNHSLVPSIDIASSRSYTLRTESLAFSPNSTYLAIAGGDDTVTVLDLEYPDKIKTLGYIERPTAVAFMNDNKTLVIGTNRSFEGSLQLWDIETLSLKREISRNAPSGGICNVAISPDGQILAAGYCTYIFDISTWDINKDFAPITRLTGLDEVGYCSHFCTDNRNIIVFNPSTGDIASGTNYMRIPFQDPRSGKKSAIVSTARRVGEIGYSPSPVNALAFTSDGAILVIAAGEELQLRDTKDGKLLWSHVYDWNVSYLSTAAITADAKLLILVDSSGNVEFWGIPYR